MIPFIVGITGPSASGKTAIAQRLQQLLPGSLVISTDNYWKAAAGISRTKNAREEELPENFDFATLAQTLLTLKAGRETTAPLWASGEQDTLQMQTLEPAAVIIVEGFLLLHDDAVRDLLDFKVYVDIPEETIVARCFEHSDHSAGGNVVALYMKYCLPTRKYADLIVDGLASADSTAHYLAAEIKSREARLLHARRDP